MPRTRDRSARRERAFSAQGAWGVLAYMVADDEGRSVDGRMNKELRAIFRAADGVKIGVAAQIDYKKTPGVFRGAATSEAPVDAAGFTLVPLRAYPQPWRQIKESLQTLKLRVESRGADRPEREDLDSSDSGVLQDFLRYGRTECLANRYLLFFNGHAHGPVGLFMDKKAGDQDPHPLRLDDLSRALRSLGVPATIVVFRDCYMNTLETAYQIRDVAKFMIASQGMAPVKGTWPWKKFLAGLRPHAKSEAVGLNLAFELGQFLDSTRGRLSEAPVTLLDLGESHLIVSPLSALVRALVRVRTRARSLAPYVDAFERARARRPGDRALLDVPRLCEHLQHVGDERVAAAARELGEVVTTRLVSWHHAQTIHFLGTSIYYKPTRYANRSVIYNKAWEQQDEAGYRKLALCRATGWDRIALMPFES